jgi:hypothetical protein
MQTLLNRDNKKFENLILKAQVIISGDGEYRTLRIVPMEAGKGEAMRYA